MENGNLIKTEIKHVMGPEEAYMAGFDRCRKVVLDMMAGDHDWKHAGLKQDAAFRKLLSEIDIERIRLIKEGPDVFKREFVYEDSEEGL